MADVAENVERGAPAPKAGSHSRSRFGAAVRREPLMAAIAAMALVGAGISVYLTTEHYAKAEPICPAGGLVNCAKVLSSTYSVVPGTQLPITFPGLLWFLVSGGLAVLALVRAAQARPEPDRLRAALLVWGGLGMLVVFYLVYAELDRIHFICLWCTVVHVLTLLTFLAAFRAWQLGPAADVPAPAVTQRPAHAHASARGAAARQRALTSRAARSIHRAGATPRGPSR